MAQSKADKSSSRKAKHRPKTKNAAGGEEGKSPIVTQLPKDQTRPNATPATEGRTDVDPRQNHAQEDEDFRANQAVTEETGSNERDRFPD